MTAIAFARSMCGSTHIYGFGNGSCPAQCYHYYDCGETAGSGGVSQAAMFADSPKAVRATGGYHNFSAQASVLRQLASSGVLDADWGTCEPSTGNPPEAFLNRRPKKTREQARREDAAKRRQRRLLGL